MSDRIFLLSPAHCSGRRAQILLRPEAEFLLALKLRQGDLVTLGEVFTFLSGLYFRGKLAYAARFGQATSTPETALVITAGRGLVSPDTPITIRDLESFASIPVNAKHPPYREPLERDAMALAKQLQSDSQVVLLGSLATAKYLDVLRGPLDGRLMFPREFLGRGDMSRGALMLRCVASGEELEYATFDEAPLRTTQGMRVK